ncbi:rod shape-determining protein MreD [Sphingobacterium bovistauri]|uniref:Rod shape-determining protein MreD n=1 Tax=Sphingobacterium bovistauri TaxID=2781959 RepID=A0ABS7Z745_9SPHI|nr:rod shape-determining protein MreD [Sphingobacterium bovistauri]MCA5004690.1 rod shape-determining protein MreD [Sphingobacterium bovistauri]
MAKIVIFNIIRFLALILLQVAVLKNIGYYNIAVAFPYILIVLLLPVGTPNIVLYILAFLTGLSIDAFYDSIGIHTAACVALAFFRIFFHKITIELDEQESFNTPSWGNMGFKWFSTYILLGTLVHHFFLFLVETFSLQNFIQTLISIVLSCLCTLVIIFVISLLTYHKKSRIIN